MSSSIINLSLVKETSMYFISQQQCNLLYSEGTRAGKKCVNFLHITSIHPIINDLSNNWNINLQYIKMLINPSVDVASIDNFRHDFERFRRIGKLELELFRQIVVFNFDQSFKSGFRGQNLRSHSWEDGFSHPNADRFTQRGPENATLSVND